MNTQKITEEQKYLLGALREQLERLKKEKLLFGELEAAKAYEDSIARIDMQIEQYYAEMDAHYDNLGNEITKDYDDKRTI